MTPAKAAPSNCGSANVDREFMTRFLTGPMEICPKVDRVAGKVPYTHTHTHKPWAAAYKTEKKKNWPKTSQIDLSTKSIKKKDKLVRFMENYSKISSIFNIYNMNINSIARSTYICI